MTTERMALTFSSRDNNDDDDLIAVAQAADRLGYESFWTGESWGRDAFTVLTMLACHTERIGLGTGIVTVYSRTPGLVAQSIASLDRISNGRAILGLGSSGRIVIEDWHGVKFDHPGKPHRRVHRHHPAGAVGGTGQLRRSVLQPEALSHGGAAGAGAGADLRGFAGKAQPGIDRPMRRTGGCPSGHIANGCPR